MVASGLFSISGSVFAEMCRTRGLFLVLSLITALTRPPVSLITDTLTWFSDNVAPSGVAIS